MFCSSNAKHAFSQSDPCMLSSACKPYANLVDAAFMVASLFLMICLLAVYVSIRLWLIAVPVVWMISFCRKQISRLPSA